MADHTPIDPEEALPFEEEDAGPLPGLVSAAASEVKSAYGPDDDDALLEQMGVEEEGVEAGQILGLVAATVVSVVALSIVLIFLFYMPKRDATLTQVANVGQYPELEQNRTEAAAKLNQFTRTDSVYTQPIDAAMTAVVGAYGGLTDRVYEADGGFAMTRQRFNTLMVNRGPGAAVQGTASLSAAPDTSAAAPAEPAAPAEEAPTTPS
jgi:hypothetical protein